MSVQSNVIHPSHKILVVVTVGGSTNSAPILEICAILAARGHVIEFATLAERETLVAPYPFVSTVHIVGRAVTAEEDERLYLNFSRWDNSTHGGRRHILRTKRFYDSFWTETYQGLNQVIAKSRPDFIFADYQVEAAKDVALQHCIPLAQMWCQMPWLMLPQKWIPGSPGFQLRCLTSENASLWDRLYEQMFLLRWGPHLLDLLLWTRRMRLAAGVKTIPLMKSKPDHVLLVNNFFGVEPAKDLPPLVQAAGPILADDWLPLDNATEQFLVNKHSVVYVAFGTHVILTAEKLEKIVLGLALALLEQRIDGVIWAIRSIARKQFDESKNYPVHGTTNQTFAGLLENRHPSWLFLDYAPQRAVLDHSSTRVFLTHAGPSSANEALFHGVPMVSMPVYGDQIQESMRLKAAGVAVEVSKDKFQPADISNAVAVILADPRGEFRRNVHRMQRIAHVAARRKHAAADLIEEHMYDWNLRFEYDPSEKSAAATSLNGGRGVELSPMHLQTADARMSWIRSTNMDEWLIVICTALGVISLASYYGKLL
ncbi:putative UDP-glucoronosyl and UDP-glucosyl transferase family protein [Rhizodiscina lignyota]|uniref:UDP-glucoronosyl and UDP-glucosyl transferase family protein n=1 Tax=Rhizodiscina lignyota TaxID=1504668 RepID=A0A9P4I538_9PEZI|nr:putative UDP-glucoronosyl and UDP-glucosyl transferase family protein [Rhizodiscina lignyota]